jgi:hypothetical protein
MSDKPTKQEEKALQKREAMPVGLDSFGMMRPGNLQEAIECAKIIAHSGMVPKDYVGNPGAILVAMQMGAEVGLTPMAAIQNIAVINGRPSLWGDAMLALIKSDPECEDIIEDDFEEIKKTGKATCTAKRRGKVPVTRSFTIDDAKTAGLWGKNTWNNYPWRMLQMRARAFALRDAFPDKLRGMRVVEEERDIVNVTPHWDGGGDELREGLHKVVRDKSTEAPIDKTEDAQLDLPTTEPKEGVQKVGKKAKGPPPKTEPSKPADDEPPTPTDEDEVNW